MSLKIITLTIPQECVLNIEEFTPEENYQMLKIGSQCLFEGRKAVAGFTQKEIIQKINNCLKIRYFINNDVRNKWCARAIN